MCRILRVAILLVLGVSRATAQIAEPSDPERFIMRYEGTLYANQQTINRCSAFMHLELAFDISIRTLTQEGRTRTEQVLRENGCLDEHSSLTVAEQAEQATGSASQRLDVSQIELVGDDVFVYINQFTNVYQSLLESLKSFNDGRLANVRRVIVDVRPNPGGSIDELYKVLDHFFSPAPNVTFLHATGSRALRTPFYETTRRGVFAGRDIVVLIGGRTASAAEWLLSTLCYEWYPDRCVSVGSDTFGKGVIQCLGSSIAGAGLRITCAEWLRPNKDAAMTGLLAFEKVNRVGFKPDRKIPLDECKFDYPCIQKVLHEAGM